MVSELEYTGDGRFAYIAKNALGQSEIRGFDPRTGIATSVISPNGLPTLTAVDAFGRVVSTATADGTVVTTTYKNCASYCPDGAASVVIQEAKRGAGTRVAVPVLQFADSAGHVIRSMTWSFDGKEIVTDSTYDVLGRPWKTYWPHQPDESDMLGEGALKSETTYDVLDRVLSTTTLDETAHAVTTTNTWSGFTQGTTNAKNHTISQTRDVWGKLATAVDANGKTTKFEFDPFGNLARTTDSKDNQVKVSYDAWGRRTQLQDPDLGTIVYTVDALGQVLSQSSPNERARGQKTTMAYDALGRMTARTSEDMSATWIYDVLPGATDCAAARSCGKLVASRTGNATTPDFYQEHSYDALGRPDTVTTQLELGAKHTTQIGYDAWGRASKETHQRGAGAAKVYDRRYNAKGYLSRIVRNGSVLWRATAQDAAGRVTSWMLGNGLTGELGYNAYTGRQESGAVKLGAATPLQEGYQYDVLGNVSQRSQTWNSEHFIEDFEYDALNRLTKATIGTNAAQDFTYDELGNITSKTGAGSGTYVYPASGANSVRPHAVSSIPGIGAFDYDGNGNMTGGAGRSASWNSFDMPVTISKGGEASTFYYGPDHQRIKQVRSGTAATTIVYAGAMEIETSGTDVTVKTYLPLGLGVEIDKGGSSKVYYTHKDRQGSVMAISDEAGVLSERMAYDSWGKRRDKTGPSTPDNVDGVLDNKGYTGHEMLDKLDLVHMNGRVYDPLVARFISADPIIQEPEHSQSYNRYTYVWNNPTNLTDPTGFQAFEVTRPANSLIPCEQDSRCGSQPPPPGPTEQSSSPSKDKTGTQQKPASVSPNTANNVLRIPQDKQPGEYGHIPGAKEALPKEGDAINTGVNVILAAEGGIGIARAAPGLLPKIMAFFGKEEAPQIMYHYTTEAGAKAIVESEKLFPSLKAANPKDARYGNGQYLSDIAPGSKTAAQLSKEFLNIPFQGARFTHYVGIDVRGLNVVQGRPGVYVIPNEADLSLINRIMSVGKNGK